MTNVPTLRITTIRPRSADPSGHYVLYWMTAFRRLRRNFSLQRAADWARELRKPLLLVEVLPCGDRFDSDRHHHFVLGGMADHVAQTEQAAVDYYPYVEPEPGEALRLLAALAEKACVVVSDDYPLPTPADATACDDLPEVRLELIDGNGLLPLRAAEKDFARAYSFRRFLQKTLPDHLLDAPMAEPLARRKLPSLNSLPRKLTRRWPPASEALLAGDARALTALPIDHNVAPVATRGGPRAAAATLREFLKHRLGRYHTDRNQPEEQATSGLSPYLHHGHISAHEVFDALTKREGWTPDRLSGRVDGKAIGWWGMSEPAEAFLDEFVTWRELGYNFCVFRPGEHDQYDALPDWARKTLAEHASDRREHVYSLDEFAKAQTHDPLWNAAQGELLSEGRLHNYLRMLWGKKILEWTRSPREAADVMIELNNRYALDGRDPNSSSGIFWVLGRYDRPWGPERKVFGKIRYMSSENTARKVRVRGYVDKYAPEDS